MTVFPYKIVDLTHVLHSEIPSWSGGCGFNHDIKLDYPQTQGKVKFRVQQIKMHAGIGTHIDAPAHCIPNGLTIDRLDLENLIAPCMVIDISQKAHETYQLSTKDIKEFEEVYGLINPHNFIIVYTGWDRFWNNPIQYRNHYIFPSVSKEAIDLLIDREIVGLGIDTLSPDCAESDFPVHNALLSTGKYIIENVAHASTIPCKGSYSLALPLKTYLGTEAAARLIALVEKSIP